MSDPRRARPRQASGFRRCARLLRSTGDAAVGDDLRESRRLDRQGLSRQRSKDCRRAGKRRTAGAAAPIAAGPATLMPRRGFGRIITAAMRDAEGGKARATGRKIGRVASRRRRSDQKLRNQDVGQRGADQRAQTFPDQMPDSHALAISRSRARRQLRRYAHVQQYSPGSFLNGQAGRSLVGR